MTAPPVRMAAAGDMAAIAGIINHYIEHSFANFRTEPQTAEDWLQDWTAHRDRYPWLVADDGSEVVGVAYAGPWSERGAYAWSAHVTVYIHRLHHRRGVGRALYGELLPLLDRMGFHTELALIALPNPGSVGLHEAFGFRSRGALREIGYKDNAWRDVGIWQRTIRRASGPPAPTAPMPGSL